MKPVSIFIITAFALLILASCNPSDPGDTADSGPCVTCHEQLTPGITDDFLDSKMAAAEVGCEDCHGNDHSSADNSELAQMPTPDTCKACHTDQYDQYAAGKHALAWVAMEAMPMLSHQPQGVGGADMTGCSGCHKIGLKSEGYTTTEGFHYGMGACDSCHTRHSFSKEEAQNPLACQTCHMGFDHAHWEMWSTSKHGTIWQIEGDTGRAPTCQTCHMSEGDHEVRTAWGFLGVRLQEADEDWMADRTVILQGLGVLDWDGNSTERLDIVASGDVARLTEEAFDAERDKMLSVCGNCHSATFATEYLDAGDDLLREADALMAEAILEVKGLYDEGILEVPDGWSYAPDLLQFYNAETEIEQELWVMFLEHRMRTFQGAFHMNPDYSHWYGWSEMNNSLASIKAEVAALRGE